jgi:hypothetical protein
LVLPFTSGYDTSLRRLSPPGGTACGRQQPYTALEGYELQDASGAPFGKVDRTVYDAPSDVLKYIISGKHTILADRIEVDVEHERVKAPYSREVIETAPGPEDPTGEFDSALRASLRGAWTKRMATQRLRSWRVRVGPLPPRRL